MAKKKKELTDEEISAMLDDEVDHTSTRPPMVSAETWAVMNEAQRDEWRKVVSGYLEMLEDESRHKRRR